MADIATVKVKPWSPDQGDFVLINESDFDPEVHELVDPAPEAKQPAPAAKKAAAKKE